MTDDKRDKLGLDPRKISKSLTTEHLIELIPTEKPKAPTTPAPTQEGQGGDNVPSAPDSGSGGDGQK